MLVELFFGRLGVGCTVNGCNKDPMFGPECPASTWTDVREVCETMVTKGWKFIEWCRDGNLGRKTRFAQESQNGQLG